VPILTDDEIARLLTTCAVSRGRPGTFDRTVFLGRRDEVVLRLLLDTGVRVSELCGLALTDVDLDRELAYVTGKGSRPRVVPFGAKTAQAVDRYLRVRALHPHARSTRLLLGQRGAMTSDGAHLRPPLARRGRSGTGPDDAGRLAQRRHAVPVRRLHRCRACPRCTPASRSRGSPVTREANGAHRREMLISRGLVPQRGHAAQGRWRCPPRPFRRSTADAVVRQPLRYRDSHRLVTIVTPPQSRVLDPLTRV
jgi:hypothetical protein